MGVDAYSAFERFGIFQFLSSERGSFDFQTPFSSPAIFMANSFYSQRELIFNGSTQDFY